jgi:hypothetical protein
VAASHSLALSTTFLKQRLELGDGFQILEAAGGALEFD